MQIIHIQKILRGITALKSNFKFSIIFHHILHFYKISHYHFTEDVDCSVLTV